MGAAVSIIARNSRETAHSERTIVPCIAFSPTASHAVARPPGISPRSLTDLCLIRFAAQGERAK